MSMRQRTQIAALPIAATPSSLLWEAVIAAVTGSAFLWLLFEGVIHSLAVFFLELYLSF